ncbi:hypothetical protein [Gordonia crocea]|uniref:Uncharacterized protein n=1 Tax=Gordonia crocea TaxID=589162 RepID=A0A7I9V0I9_9ACTN|nr:hypothetical protein [Gordonia crocea]GED96051.1 hypothetical protein nbrc107697_00900 [Gordonia crocea]GED98957.1 hypothetical protein nbrc107697_29960 [Gordonia crocea]
MSRRGSGALLAVSAGSSALVLGAGMRGGSLLMRDAVSTPRSYLTDAALGLGESPARAVPQDALLAMVGAVLPGTGVVIALTWIALMLSGIGAGILAGRVVSDAGWAPRCAAALVAVWNPWVVERMMQGHWSLFAGYAAIPWILVAAERIWRSEAAGWPLLWAAVLGAGLTPTGSVLAAAAVLAAVILPAPTNPRRLFAALAAVVIGAAPWLVATALGSASTVGDPAGAQVFSLRAEPGLGRVLTAFGMAGIWNADAVPASRTTWWAAVATVLFLAVVAAGWWHLRRREGRESRGLAIIAAALALTTVAFVVLASTSWGVSTMGWAVEHIAGAGLFRDTQKFLALCLPAVAIGVAGAVAGLGRFVPAGFALTGVAVLIVAPLPDGAARLHPVDLPADWQTVAQMIPKDQGAVALWPTGMIRDYSFTSTPSLDPARRLLRAPVLESGALDIDGTTVDANPTRRAAALERALTEGAGPSVLASHGVGWVLVEEPERTGTPSGLSTATPVFDGDYLRLYRIENPAVIPGASALSRAVVIGAHLVWLLGLFSALVLVAGRIGQRGARTCSKTAVNPSAVADQE